MKKQKQNNNKNKKKISIIIILLILIILILGSIFLLFKTTNNNEEQEENEITYTELIKKMDNGEVEKIEMTVGSSAIKVKLKDIEEEKSSIIPNTQTFVELLQENVRNGKEIVFEQKKPSVILRIADTLFSLLPTILIIALFVLIIKMQGLGDKGKIYGGEENNETGVTFEDVAGLDEEKGELIEIVDFLKYPKKFQDMGAKIPRGILLCGKPGTGKTLIAKAIAGEAGVPFISMSGSEFIEMFAGLGASRVRKLFEKAKKISPCIVFIDEIDAIGARRNGGSGGDSENNQTLNQLLVEMDGFETNETVIVSYCTGSN